MGVLEPIPDGASSRFVPLTTLLAMELPLSQALAIGLALTREIEAVHRSGRMHTYLDAGGIEVDSRTHEARLTLPLIELPAEGVLPAPTALVGDPKYIAPERTGRLNHPVDQRADLYSLGVILYGLFAGRLPFQSADRGELIHAHLARRPVSPSALNAAIPEAVSRVVLRLLAKDADDRYATATGLAIDVQSLIDAWRDGSGIDDFQPGKNEADRRFQVSRKLVGRDEHLALLRGALDRGGWGRVEIVLVSGAPGVGKSMLVAEAKRTLAEECAFISGKYEQYRRNVPYSAIASAFEDLVRRLLAEPEDVLADWRQRIVEALGAHAQLIVDIIPDLVHIIGQQPPAPVLGPVEARNRLHRVFGDFVAVFARRDRGLVLFLDDLQWSDAASLTLVEALLTDPMTRHLLLVGAYRDNEVSQSHPLNHLLVSLAGAGVKVTELSLTELSLEQTQAVVSASLRCATSECAPLASRLHERTGGNPFFLGQFLRVLHEREHLRLDPVTGGWRWDEGSIEFEALTGEVTDLLTRRLTRFPQATREALTAASCLGAIFDRNTLATVLSQSTDEVKERLASAVRAGLIEPREDTGRSGYSFIHDRVQQAAFALIHDDDVNAFRYRIGRSVLESTSEERLEDVLFEVVDNLNHGADLPLSDQEKLELAKLNLAAGQRARASLAHGDSVRFLRVGIAALPADRWQSEYELTYSLYLDCFECEYLAGDLESADSRFEELVQNVRTRLDAAQVQYTRVLLLTSRGEYADAVSSGLVALGGFGIRLPQKAREHHILWELLKSWFYRRGRRIERLGELPPLDHPELSAITRLLVSFCPAAYFHDPNIMMLAALKIVNISLRRGNPPAASFGYVLMALILGAGMGRYRAAHAFGDLAVRLSWNNDDVAMRSKVVLIFAGFVEFWTCPVDDAIHRLRDGFRISLDAGDHQYANYCAVQHQSLAFFRGARLSTVSDLSERYASFIDGTRDPFSIDAYRTLRQTVRALRGETGSGWVMSSAEWDETTEVQRLSDNANPTSLYYYHVWKLQLCYHFRRLDEALALALATTRAFEAGFSQICQVEQALFSGLTCTAMMSARKGDRRKLRRLLGRSLRALKKWSKTCPDNFLAPYLLLLAERSRSVWRVDQTMGLYEGAIETARAGGFLNLEALANERAADFHRQAGRHGVGRAYLHEATRLYGQWGASRKVDHLFEVDPSLKNSLEATTALLPEVAEARTGALRELEIETAMKAAQAISTEMEMSRSLQRLVEVTLEAGGAERCALALEEEGELRLQAMGSVDDAEVQVLMARPLGDQQEVCEAAVHYSARTKRPLAIADARTDGRFQDSPYVRERQPLSILALPLLRRGVVMGVLYLENNLAVGVFTPDKLRVLELVAAKLVIALENVRLLEGQRTHAKDLQSAMRRVDILQKAKMHLAKFVPQSVQQIIDDNPDAPALEKRPRDVSILFLDIAGYTKLAEALDGARIDYLVERYFSAFLHDILVNGGDINETAGDGLMILFLDPDRNVHAAQAARTALAIRDRTQQINEQVRGSFDPVQVNIGINSGQALVGSTRLEASGGTRYTYTATGSVTNVAARIAAASEGGNILVSEDTARRLDEAFLLGPLEEHQFKNVSERVQVRRLEGESGARRQSSPS